MPINFTKKEQEKFKKVGELANKLEISKASAGINTQTADVMGDVVQEMVADMYLKDKFEVLQMIATNTIAQEFKGLKSVEGRYTTSPDKEPATSGGVLEGKRAPVSTPEFEEKSDTFKTTGREFVVTHESTWNSKEDAYGFGVNKGLESFYINKNKALMNANVKALGKAVIASAVAATGGALAAGDYSVVAVPLSSKAAAQYRNLNVKFARIESKVTVTYADGRTELRNNGVGIASNASTVTVVANGAITATAELKRGVYGYAWFVNGSLQAISTTNRVTISALVANTQLLTTVLADDCSVEEHIYPGAINLVVTDDAPDFSEFLAPGEEFEVGTLGTVKQVNEVLERAKALYDVEFDALVMSPAVYKKLNAKCLEGVSTVINPAQDGGKQIVVGGGITHYPHPVTQKLLPIRVLKDAPNGILFWSDELQNSLPGVVAPMERIVREPLHFLKFAETERQFEGGWYESDVLRLNAHYAFFYLGNIA